MASFVVATFRDKKHIRGYRIFNLSNGGQDISVRDVTTGELQNLIALRPSASLINGRIKPDGTIDLTQGALSAYPILSDRGQLLSVSGLTIVYSVVDENDKTLGYGVVDAFGKLANISKRKLMELAARFKPTNWETYTTRNGETEIRAKSGSFIKVQMAKARNIQTINSFSESQEEIDKKKRVIAKEVDLLRQEEEKCNAELMADNILLDNQIQQDVKTALDSGMTKEELAKKASHVSSELLSMNSNRVLPCLKVYDFADIIGTQVAVDSQKKLTLVKLNLLKIAPFYATMFDAIKKEQTTAIPTMAVSEDTFYYNPDFLAQQDVSEATFVIIHEMLHIAMQHPVRHGRRQNEAWNIACDLYINSIICRDFGVKFGDSATSIQRESIIDKKTYTGTIKTPSLGVFVETFGMTLDFARDTAESLYNKIIKENPDLANQSSGGNQGQSGQQSSQGGQQGGQGQQSGGSQQGQQSGSSQNSGDSQQNSNNGSSNSSNGQNGQQSSDTQGNQSGNEQGISSEQQRQEGQGGQGGQPSGGSQDGSSGGQPSSQGSSPQGSQQGSEGADSGQYGNDSGQSGEQGSNSSNNGQNDGQGDDNHQNNQGNGDSGDSLDNSSNDFDGLGNDATVDKDESTLAEDLQGSNNEEYGQKEVEMNITLNGVTRRVRLPLDIVSNRDTVAKDSPKQSMDETKNILKRIRMKKDIAIHQGKDMSMSPIAVMVDREINFALTVSYNWEQILRTLANEKPKKMYTLSKPERTYMQIGATLASRQKFGKPSKISGIKFGVDVSGSQGDEELGKIFSKISEILTQFEVSAEMIYWDTQVTNVGDFEDMRSMLKIQPTGCGGTDVKCLFEYLLGTTKAGNGHKEETRLKDITAVMIFTDGYISHDYGAYAKYFGRTTYWVIDESSPAFTPLFGKVIKARLKK